MKRTCASVDSLERYWLALEEAKNTGTLTDHEIQVSLGSHNVFRFAKGLQKAGLREVLVLVMNKPSWMSTSAFHIDSW